jgi:hypothetical protein
MCRKVAHRQSKIIGTSVFAAGIRLCSTNHNRCVLKVGLGNRSYSTRYYTRAVTSNRNDGL